MDTLKNKMVTTPILVFRDWKKEFHVHVDSSSVTLDMVLMHPNEGSIDHPIYFANKKLSTIENSYTMTGLFFKDPNNILKYRILGNCFGLKKCIFIDR